MKATIQFSVERQNTTKQVKEKLKSIETQDISQKRDQMKQFIEGKIA